MKALLICPSHRPEVAALAATGPLVQLPVLGKNLIDVWLEHLVGLGAKEVLVLAADRPDEVRRCVNDGARWGLRTQVIVEPRELTRSEAFLKYRSSNRHGWLPEPFAINHLEHLPALPAENLFVGYRNFFEGLGAWLEQRARDSRVGVREISPQVFVGLRARIAPTARLLAPCWIGEEAQVGDAAVVGPGAIIEDRAVVGCGCEVSRSLIGPDTLLGAWTEVSNSIAWGSLLINWQSGSSTNVPDPFLCSSLRAESNSGQPNTWVERSMAAALLALTAPVAALAVLSAKCRGQRAFRTRVAVRPDQRPALDRKTILYSELVAAKGILRRWPQLWKIVLGDFAWLGHRPVSPSEFARFRNDFDRLRITWPLGLFSLGEEVERSEDQEHDADSAPGNGEATSGANLARLRTSGQALNVIGLSELGAANAPAVGDQCARALSRHHRTIDVDLSETVFVDASGVGTLLFLHQLAGRHEGRVRLLNPKPEVRQFLELTRMHHIVEIAEEIRPGSRPQVRPSTPPREAAGAVGTHARYAPENGG